MIISVLSLFLTVPLLGIYDSSFPHIIKKIGGGCNYFKKNLIFAADSCALCVAVQLFVVNNRSVMLFSCKLKT